MVEKTMSEPQSRRADWTVEELERRLSAEDDFYLFDVRNRDEFEAGPIEGKRPIPTVNVPYFEMLEWGEAFDFVESVVDYVEAKLADELPRDKEILAVCAKGDTSEYVAEALGKLGYDARHLEGGTQAWGDFYTSRPVVEDEELSIYQVARPARGCLSYLVASNGKAAVIDPLRHVEHYVRLAERLGLEIELVLDTHGHADHVSGGVELARRAGVDYRLHPYDGIHPLDVLPATIDYLYLKDGWSAELGATRVEAIHIPGHTLGNLAFRVGGYLFTGDSIFIHSIARPDLGGHGETWAPIHFASLARLLELPDETVVLPAHFSSPTEADAEGVYRGPLAALKRDNEGLVKVAEGEEAFVAYILASLPKFPPQYVEIKRVNAGLSSPDEEELSELELGKNICALSQAYELVEGATHDSEVA